MFAPGVERDKSAGRGTADAGVLRAGERAVLAIDEGLHFFNEKLCVAVGTAAAEFGDVSGSVFANARLRVLHADDDQRSARSRLNALIGGLSHVPLFPRA